MYFHNSIFFLVPRRNIFHFIVFILFLEFNKLYFFKEIDDIELLLQDKQPNLN